MNKIIPTKNIDLTTIKIQHEYLNELFNNIEFFSSEQNPSIYSIKVYFDKAIEILEAHEKLEQEVVKKIKNL